MLTPSSLPVRQPLVQKITATPDKLKSDPLPSHRLTFAVVVLMVTFCIGAATAMAWQVFGGAAKEMIANANPPLGSPAPQAAAQDNPVAVAPPAAPADPQPPNSLDAVQQSIDQITASQHQIMHSVGLLGANQDQIARNVDQLAAGQQQMTREIAKLHDIAQYLLYKSSEPRPQPASAPAHNPVLRPQRTPTAH